MTQPKSSPSIAVWIWGYWPRLNPTEDLCLRIAVHTGVPGAWRDAANELPLLPSGGEFLERFFLAACRRDYRLLVDSESKAFSGTRRISGTRDVRSWLSDRGERPGPILATVALTPAANDRAEHLTSLFRALPNDEDVYRQTLDAGVILVTLWDHACTLTAPASVASRTIEWLRTAGRSVSGSIIEWDVAAEMP
jgi:hypothetical protein